MNFYHSMEIEDKDIGKNDSIWNYDVKHQYNDDIQTPFDVVVWVEIELPTSLSHTQSQLYIPNSRNSFVDRHQ